MIKLFNETKPKLFLVISVFILLSFSSFIRADVQELTLRDSIINALDNNPDILKARIDLEESENYFQRALKVDEKELIEEAEEELEMVQKNYNQEQKNVIEEARQKYFNLLQSEESLETLEKDRQRKEEQLEVDEKKYEMGLISKINLEQSRHSLQQTKRNYDFAEKNLKTTYMEFNEFLGKELNTAIELTEREEPELKFLEESLEEVYEIALKNRSDMINIREEVEDKKKHLENIDNEYTPQIEIEKAENELRKKEIEYTQQKNSLYFQIRNQFFSLQSDKEDIDEARRELELAREEKEETEIKYEAEQISTQEMINAQDALAEAEENLIETKWDYHDSRIDFLEFIGIWDLKDYIEMYDLDEEDIQIKGDKDEN